MARLNDNRLTLPPERYVREDHRLPKKIKGLYVCEVAPDGKHGDTFDSGKLASWALNNRGGLVEMAGIAVGGNAPGGQPRYQPRMSR